MLSQYSALNVYLVEPSQVQARVISAWLGQLGVVSIERFDSAAAMFNKMAGQLPSLVISALYLPDMSGTELVQRLRADSVTETDRREAFQAISPDVESGLFLVPKVIE